MPALPEPAVVTPPPSRAPLPTARAQPADDTAPVSKTAVPQTSLAERGAGPDEVTVRFTRWTSHGQTAYQKGQFAGFPLHIAEGFERSGVAILDPGLRRVTATNRMVRK